MDEKWWTKRGVQNSGLILLALLGVTVLIYRDVVSRAKESYQQGETYMEWNAHPEKKTAFFEAKFAESKGRFDKFLAARKNTENEYKRKKESREFDKKFALEESSLKYAYQWYKDTYELFSPPESKWVRLSREKAPHALELWKKELTDKKIPFEDTMFE